MAETFNCPSCGAPLAYDAEKQENKATISCPYCNESVIVPKELREVEDELAEAEAAPVRVQVIGQGDPAGSSVARSLRSCMVVGIVIAVAAAGIVFFAMNNIKQTVTQALGGIPAAVLTPAPTYDPHSVETQIAPAMAKVTEAVAQVTKAAASSTPRPTATVNTTATAEIEATNTALNAMMAQQRSWPVVLQEKFTSSARGWNTGQDNDNLAISNQTISGGKYTWKMTSKKSMGSFSYPNMPAQKDMYVSVDLQMTTSAGNTSDQGGIIFRAATNEQSFYFFSVNTDGAYSLSFYDGSNWNDLIGITQTSLVKPGEVNHLAVSMEGSQILLMINDAVAASYEDARSASGIAGLGINMPAPGEDDTFVFSNFYVRAPKK